MDKRIKKKDILKTLLFVLPYILVEFSNTMFVIIDKSLSNSIGKTAIIVFSSFITLNWAINTIQGCIKQAHSIVLVRDKKNHKDINTTGVAIELFCSIITGILLFTFARQITYVYELEENAREILTIILKMKAIELPFYSVGYIFLNDLKIKNKNKQIFIVMMISYAINIIGDLISIKNGYNEIGIYIATIVSTIINTFLLQIVSKFRPGKVTKKYAKEIIIYGKDLAFNKIMQRIVNILYTRVASSFGTNIYAIHCACITVSDTITEVVEGYYSGLLVSYSKDIEEKKENLVKKADTIEILGILFSIIIAIIIVYPSWWLLGRAVPWNECNPYIWFYTIEFIVTVGSTNYRAYLSAHKNTKAIRNMALIGGICVRLPLVMIVKYTNLGLIGLSLVCGIDRIVRTIYLRTYINKNKIGVEIKNN